MLNKVSGTTYASNIFKITHFLSKNIIIFFDSFIDELYVGINVPTYKQQGQLLANGVFVRDCFIFLI